MSEKTLLRKDVPLKDTWDPSHVYATTQDWENDFAWIQQQCAVPVSYTHLTLPTICSV